MKIFITGAHGMVGRNIYEILEDQHQIFGPDHLELDLRNYSAVLEFLKKHKPDLIIHCAGVVGGIQANIANPVKFLVDNLDIGRNVIMAARETSCKKLLNMGSSCMYPRNIDGSIPEEMVLKGELEPTNEGYAIAKVSVAKLCEYINKEDPSFNFKTLIPCNLYGRYDKFDPIHSHMIPAVIRKIYDATKNSVNEVDIWGDGTARREFMYVGDLANFVSYAIAKIESMPSYLNVGLGHDYSINEYYQAIAEAIGFNGQFKHDLTKPTGMKRKLVDVTKLSQFGWSYKTSLTDGIKKTYNYYINEVVKNE
jgi:GDP-L-fucose synthase